MSEFERIDPTDVTLLEVPAEEAPPFRDPDPVEVIKRKRGRPRKQAQQAAGDPQTDVEAPLDAPMPPKAEDQKQEPKSAPSPSQAWKLDAEMIGFGVAAVFGVIATMTQHQHWLRTPEQCAPISEPLQRMYSRLPAARRKAVLHYLDPGVLLAGIYQVAGPSIAVEMELAQARRRGSILPPTRGGRQPAAGAPPPPAPAPADPGKVPSLEGVFGAAEVLQ